MNKLILLLLIVVSACNKPEMEVEPTVKCNDIYQYGPFAFHSVPEGHYDFIEDGVKYVCISTNSTGHCENRVVLGSGKTECN